MGLFAKVAFLQDVPNALEANNFSNKMSNLFSVEHVTTRVFEK